MFWAVFENGGISYTQNTLLYAFYPTGSRGEGKISKLSDTLEKFNFVPYPEIFQGLNILSPPKMKESSSKICFSILPLNICYPTGRSDNSKYLFEDIRVLAFSLPFRGDKRSRLHRKFNDRILIKNLNI